MKSWRTTLYGALTALAVLISAIAEPLLDTDPATLPNWTVAFAAVTGFIAAFCARDNKVSSEAAGIK